MADIGGPFNAHEVEPNDFSPLPEGSYTCVIEASENKATKDGSGSYLELTLQVIDGDYKGRKLFDRLNLNNPNQKAVQIARGTLSAICRATGVMTPNDSVELHDIPLVVKVACRKREDNGEISNEVKGYKSTKDAAPARPSANHAPQTHGVQSHTPPWRK